MKKSISIISLIVVLTLLAIVFAGCNDDTYVDPAGTTYLAVTDESGNTMLNDDGDIIIYQTATDGSIITDSSGVPETVATYFPDIIVDGDYVQTPTYTLTLPNGWSADKANAGYYTKKSQDATVQISIIQNETLEAYRKHTASVLKQLKEKITDGSMTISEESFQYLPAATTAYQYTLRSTGSNSDSTKIELIFEHSGNLYKMLYDAPTSNLENASFIEFYSAIHYKNYAYYDETTTGN